MIQIMEQKMDQKIEAVQKMQDYIEQHLMEEITLADLARVSLFSPWYALRLFKEYTNYTPAEYIRRLRLSKSALRLRDGDCKIIDIAYEMGFKSVDGYQRAFLREFGYNPHEYAKNPSPIYLFIPYGVMSQNYRKEARNMENLRNVFIQVLHKPARKVVVKRGTTASDYFAYCEEVGCDVWGLLTSIRSISHEPVCMWLPKKYRLSNTSEYVQGTEVSMDYDGEIPEGFDLMTLPEADFLMFQGEPFKEEEYCQAIAEIQESINRYHPEAIGYHWKKEGIRIQLEPIGTRGYIEMLEIEN